MKIAITGGSGFIGTQLCTLLQGQGHEIIILDIAPSITFPDQRLDVDVRDEAKMIEATKGCDAIYHLAAEHRDDVSPLSLYYDVNVEGGKNVIKAAEANNIKKIIFTSTVAVYGLDKEASKETDPADPFNDYGWSKYKSEETFREWASKDTANSMTILRLVATFGTGNRGNIYNLLKQIASGRFLMIGNGKNHKSIAYVGNVAAFIAKTLEFGAGLHLYNYADKPDLNMKEMVDNVYKTLDKGKPPASIPYPIGLAGGYCFDIFAKLSGKKLPISSVRVKKFCADTVINAKKIKETGFQAPYTLEYGLSEMLRAEFLENPKDIPQTKKAA